MSNLQGPFGPKAMGVPDLGALSGAQRPPRTDAEGNIMVSFEAALLNSIGSLTNEVAGIRWAMMPDEAKDHHPALKALSNGSFGVYCVACSDQHGDFINPCVQLDDDSRANWPPNVVVSAPGTGAQPA